MKMTLDKLNMQEWGCSSKSVNKSNNLIFEGFSTCWHVESGDCPLDLLGKGMALVGALIPALLAR